jgi:hypothetical protein
MNRIAYLVALALPLALSNGCSTSTTSPVISLDRIDEKSDGPSIPLDPQMSYSVSIVDLNGQWADGAGAPTPLNINLDGLRTAQCVATDTTGCYNVPDDFGGQRVSGQQLMDGSQIAVESPDADSTSSDDSNAPKVGPTTGVLGFLNAAIQGTGMYRLNFKFDGFKITGVTAGIVVKF